MKDKEKQIEELANLLYCDRFDTPFTDCEKDIKCMDCIEKKIINKGYQKVGKDSVVISKEEYEQLAIEYKRWEKLAIEDMLTQERKETIKEFMFKIESALGYYNDYDRIDKASILEWVGEIANELVKEEEYARV